MVKVTFILHSSFLVELSHCYLLFDYYAGELPELDGEKPLYVFASHSHPDHFDPVIFSLPKAGQQVFFLLSSDIFKSRVPEEFLEHTIFVEPHATYVAGDLTAVTLESTDMGVAFLLRCEDKLFYHAGDLNCWAWDGAPRFQNDAMREKYRQELTALSGKEIDLAFVPLDPRQEQYFDLGLNYFLEAASAKYIFPMHMWEDYTVIDQFQEKPEYEGIKLMDVDLPGKVFTLEK